MKKGLFFIFFLYSVFLFAQATMNIELMETIDRVCSYHQAKVYAKGNRLFVNASGALEVYYINQDGTLSLQTYFPQIESGLAVKIVADSLYLLTAYPDSYFLNEQKLQVFDISGNNFELSNEIILENQESSRLQANNEYLIIKPNNSITSSIFDRYTLQEIGEIDTGTFYGVYNNYLFIEFTDGIQSSIQILDISDILYPIQLAFYPTGNFEQNWSYKVKDNYLFITRNWSVQIIDISDITNPVLVSQIDNIPDADPNANVIIDSFVKDNYLIFYNQNAIIWVYDISNIHNPMLLYTFQDLESFSNQWPFITIKDNFLLSATFSHNVSSYSISNLPCIDYIYSTEQTGQFFYDFLYNIQNKLYNLHQISDNVQLYSLNLENNNIENYDLYGMFSFYNPIPSDSFLTIYDDKHNQLVITKVYPDSLHKLGYYNDYDAYNEYYFVKGDRLFLANQQTGNISVLDLNSDNFLNEITDCNLGITNFYNTKYANIFYDDYIFFSYNLNNQKRIKIIDNDFNEITDFRLMNNTSHSNIAFLTPNLFVNVLPDQHVLQLVRYEFPDSLIQTDYISTNFSSLISSNNDSIIAFQLDGSGNIRFLTISDEHFTSNFVYNFNFNINNIYFLPEEHKFYTIGTYYIKEYSYQLTGSEDDYITPVSKPIMLNYPNPFNPSTTISFTSQKAIKDTKIEIYNLKGEKIREINVDNCKSGENKIVWDGKDNQGKKIAAGVYLYSLKQNGKRKSTKKMIMLK